jgi:hypothetical protein
MNAQGVVLTGIVSSCDPVHDHSAGKGSLMDKAREPVINCPHCGEPVTQPGYCRGGQAAMARWELCDVLFDPTDVVNRRRRSDPQRSGSDAKSGCMGR